MKILIDARLYGLENAGLGRYVMNLVKGLTKIDKDNEYTILLRKGYFQGLKLPKNWTKELFDFRHYGLAEQTKLPKLIKSKGVDLTHFPHFNVPLTFNGNFVVTIHDLIMHKSHGRETTTLPFYLYGIKRLAYHFIFKHAVLASKKIIVPTRQVKKEVADFYKIDKKKVEVTYEGFDDAFLKKAKGKDVLKKFGLLKNPYFLYVGNAYPHKNLERAIEAIVSLNKTNKERVLFAIASSRNVFTQRLEKKIKKLNFQKYVKLLGFVTDEELASLYKNAQAFVYPSFMEGFGLQGLESISAGTLVLASNIPIFKEVYKNNVIYFNPHDFTSIKKAMQEALDMSESRKKGIVKKGQEFIKRYSWDKMAKKTLKVYENCISI